jgi:polar amino acid transport system substrate-binding protein
MLARKTATSHLIVLLCALVFGACGQAHANEAIVWATPDFAPYFILQGDKKGQGYSEAYINFFENKLPEYDHQRRVMSLTEYMSAAREEQDVCFCDLLKTPEREEVLYYSAPINLVTALRVYTLPNGPIPPSLSNTVSMDELLDNFTLNVSFEDGRSYSKTLDQLIRDHKDMPNIRMEYGTPEQILQMLVARRLDYMVEYPYAVAAMERKLDIHVKLVPLRIKEQKPYTVAYVTCAKTPSGKAVIERINDILKNIIDTPEYKKLFLYPSTSLLEPDRKEFEELYKTFLTLDK